MSEPSTENAAVIGSLLKEKSLWAIYRSSRAIKFSRRNLWAGLVAALLAFLWSLNAKSAGAVTDQFHELASLAFNTTIGLLGFLLAGFSFFATVYDKKMFCRMAEITHEESGLSYLKYNFFSFMRMFCEYFVFALVSLLFCEVFAKESGARLWLSGVADLVRWPEAITVTVSPKQIAASLLYGLFFGTAAYLLMQLQSFIFNIYHVSMSSIRWALEEEYDKANDAVGRRSSASDEQESPEATQGNQHD